MKISRYWFTMLFVGASWACAGDQPPGEKDPDASFGTTVAGGGRVELVPDRGEDAQGEGEGSTLAYVRKMEEQRALQRDRFEELRQEKERALQRLAAEHDLIRETMRHIRSASGEGAPWVASAESGGDDPVAAKGPLPTSTLR